MADKEKCVDDLSSFLSRSAREMGKVLSRLKWKKENLLKQVDSSNSVHCPINPSHRIPASRLEKHLSICQFTSKGIRPQDACSSPEFFYQTCSTVIPVFIDERQYSAFKNGKERCELDPEPPNNSFNRKAIPMCCSVKSIGDRATLNAHNIHTKEKNLHSDFVDEIRSIMAWEEIPASHRQLRVNLLSQENIKTWIIGNLPQVQYLSSLEGASNRLVDFVLSCLQEEKVCHPSGMKEMLKDLLGDETQSFVLNLWKFLAVSITNEKNYTNQSSMEERMQESLDNINSSTTDVLETVSDESYVLKEVPLPMDLVISDLSPQQRLAVYEHVIQTSKAKLEGQKEDVDLTVESDPNNPKDTQGDESKSRFEVLAEQRDYKRRRQSYRAKNVHITKRSAVEVMRDLIETQMHVLEMEFKEEHGVSGNNSDDGEASTERRDSAADQKDNTGRDSSREQKYNTGRGSSRDQKDNTGRDSSRDEEGVLRMERDRRQHREGNKRVRYHDDREMESKRTRR